MPGAISVQPGRPRVLAYGPDIRNDLVLLEADESLVDELLLHGAQIKGGPSECAVLCTENATFSLKTVGTTNSVFVVRDQSPLMELSQNVLSPARTPLGHTVGLATQQQRDAQATGQPRVNIVSQLDTHLELVPVAPRLHQLHSLLREHAYSGPDDADEQADAMSPALPGLTTEELLETVQMSRGELLAALRALPVVALEGRWRWIDQEYLDLMLQLLLLCAAERGWALVPGSALDAARLQAALEDSRVPSALARHCLDRFGSTESSLWTVDAAAVARAIGAQLLTREAGKVQTWPLAEFERLWSSQLPEGFSVDWQSLGGLAVVDHESQTLGYLPVEGLPPLPRERFQALFAFRPRWSLEQLEPYMQGLGDPGESKEALLLKHTRAIQPLPDGPVVYGAR